MKVVVSKPELAVQISKPVLVGRPTHVKIDGAVQPSLKNGPASTVRGHVTQHFNWFAAIWIDGVHSTRCETILKELEAAFGSY